MGSEHMVCGSCAHPVAEGRCPVCRQARSQLDRGLSPYAVAVALVLLAAALAMLIGHPL